MPSLPHAASQAPVPPVATTHDGAAQAQAALLQRCPALAQMTAVVVTFNSAHCAAALGAQLQGWPHVIIVDNGSEDDTPARLQAALPQAKVIALGRNLGFGTANNRAFAQARTPFCLMMNPDCAVQAEHAQALHDTARHYPEAAIVVPQLTGSDGQPQLNYGWVRDWWSARGPGAEGVACVGNACGAAMLLRMDCAPQQGWFDERFFLYYEDEDLCLRLLRERRPIIVQPAVRVAHANRGSVRGPRPLRVEYGRGYHHARSKVLFTAKHRGPQAAAAHRRSSLAAALALLVPRVLLPSPRHLARLWGRICGLWGAPTHY